MMIDSFRIYGPSVDDWWLYCPPSHSCPGCLTCWVLFADFSPNSLEVWRRAVGFAVDFEEIKEGQRFWLDASPNLPACWLPVGQSRGTENWIESQELSQEWRNFTGRPFGAVIGFLSHLFSFLSFRLMNTLQIRFEYGCTTMILLVLFLIVKDVRQIAKTFDWFIQRRACSTQFKKIWIWETIESLFQFLECINRTSTENRQFVSNRFCFLFGEDITKLDKPTITIPVNHSNRRVYFEINFGKPPILFTSFNDLHLWHETN